MRESLRPTLHFLMVFIGLFIFFAGGALWFGFADHDHHYEYNGAYDHQPEEWDQNNAIDPRTNVYEDWVEYDELTPRDERIFQQARDGKEFVFQSFEDVPPTLVTRDGTYYLFDYYQTFDWSDPRTSGPALTVLLGFMIVFEGIRREQFTHVPVYRNLYRKLTGPIRRILKR